MPPTPNTNPGYAVAGNVVLAEMRGEEGQGRRLGDRETVIDVRKVSRWLQIDQKSFSAISSTSRYIQSLS